MPQKNTYTHWSDEQISEMISLYESGMTLADVGQAFNLTRQRISEIFKKAGYKPRGNNESKKRRPHKSQYPILDAQFLTRYYIDEGLNMQEMSERLKIPYSQIRSSLLYHKIPIRPSSSYLPSPLTRELLEPLYLKDGLTAGEIAGRLGYSKIAIQKRLSELGIKKTDSVRCGGEFAIKREAIKMGKTNQQDNK